MKDLKWSALKIPKGRPNKDLSAYLDRVYDLNRELIDTTAEKRGTGLWGTHIEGYTFLKTEVVGLMTRNAGLTAGQAVKALGRTEMFVSRTDRRLMNIQAAILKNPELYKALRIAWGWNRPLDWNQLRVTEDPNVYAFGDDILIDCLPSPIGVDFIYNGERHRVPLSERIQ